MEMTQRELGLVVPKEPEKPKREFLPLEFQLDSDRLLAHSAFQALYQLTSTGGICLPGREANASRRRLLLTLAVEFLGTNVEFWEYT